MDAELRQRLQELGMSGSDAGTEVDDEEVLFGSFAAYLLHVR